jgi:hypothetical protein
MKWFKNLRTFGGNQKIKCELDNRGYPCMLIGYTDDHSSHVCYVFNLNNQAIFMSLNVVWLHKLFRQHMKTKSALIPGFTAYDVTPANKHHVTVPPAVAPTNAPAPIPQRLTLATAPRIFTFPTVTSPSALPLFLVSWIFNHHLQPLVFLLRNLKAVNLLLISLCLLIIELFLYTKDY